MYQIKGYVVVYENVNIADEGGHLASCDDAEIAASIAKVINDSTNAIAPIERTNVPTFAEVRGILKE